MHPNHYPMVFHMVVSTFYKQCARQPHLNMLFEPQIVCWVLKVLTAHNRYVWARWHALPKQRHPGAVPVCGAVSWNAASCEMLSGSWLWYHSCYNRRTLNQILCCREGWCDCLAAPGGTWWLFITGDVRGVSATSVTREGIMGGEPHDRSVKGWAKPQRLNLQRCIFSYGWYCPWLHTDFDLHVVLSRLFFQRREWLEPDRCSFFPASHVSSSKVILVYVPNKIYKSHSHKIIPSFFLVAFT